MWAGARDSCSWSPASALGTKLGFASGETERRGSAGGLPGSMEGVACALAVGDCWTLGWDTGKTGRECLKVGSLWDL